MMKAQVRSPAEELLPGVLDKDGRYDVVELAKFLDWTRQDLARFLETDPSVISRDASPRKHQDTLAKLAALMRHLLDQTGNDVGQARAWLRTPIPVLDRKSPKELILNGRFDAVSALLEEMDAGFAA